MSTPSSENASSRGLRDRPLGKALLLGAVLTAAFLASRSCAETPRNVTKEEAIEIARDETSFEPDRVQVRFVKQGVPEPRSFWAVSLYTLAADGTPKRVNVLRIDAATGEVVR